jgi:hypothetical protein
MADDSVKVKCRNKSYMGVDQYGQTYHGLKHPRKDLMSKLGASGATLMYVGNGTPVGYLINGLQISVYEVCNWKPER